MNRGIRYPGIRVIGVMLKRNFSSEAWPIKIKRLPAKEGAQAAGIVEHQAALALAADCGRMTNKLEVIGSSVGLVPASALVSIKRSSFLNSSQHGVRPLLINRRRCDSKGCRGASHDRSGKEGISS